MTDQERQLVQTIAREVLAVLRERGLVPSPGSQTAPTADNPHRADIHPPIGVCTGDYSQFPELAGRLNPPAPTTATPPTAPAAAPANSSTSQIPNPTSHIPPDPIPLTGIITANQLEAAMKSSPGGIAVLAPDARLTPLANDLARQHAKYVRRATAITTTSGPGAPSALAAADLPWLWWIDGSCRVVQEVTTQRRSQLRPSSATATPGSLANVVRELSAAVKSRRIAGGILFVHNAARAVCLANRCLNLRAVVATCGEAVEQGVTDLGANVLIVEYPHHGLRSMSAVVDRIIQQPPKPPPAVERELADLHRCG